jgi:hypothetical protein
MRSIISRWFLFGLLVGWSLTHATVFGQSTGKDMKPAAVDKLRQALDKTITVDFTGQSLIETLNHIRDRAGLKVKIDDQALAAIGMHPLLNGGGGGAPEAIHVKATNEKTSQVLRKFLSPYQLCYVIIDDTLLITSEDTAVMRQMRQRVSIDFDEVPLKKAVRELAKNHAINLVIDPKVMKQSETPVSLQLENTGIETALRLLAEMANLKAVRMGNVMFITSEEKAKKIREEEQHQFDNPLNPNLPAIVGNAMGGIFGGGIAMPAPAVQVQVRPPNPAPPPPIADVPPLPKQADPQKPVEAPPLPKGAPQAPPPPQRIDPPALERAPVQRREP